MSSELYSSQQKFAQPEMSSYFPGYQYETGKTHYRSEEETQISRIDSFRVEVEMIAPLLARLNDENNELKYQKEFICEQMGIVSETSQFLAQQNQQLMNHYKLRSLDLKKLINTIMTNASQNHNDLSQAINSYTHCNSQLLREIECALIQNEEIHHSIIRLNGMVMGSSQKKHELDKLRQGIDIKNEKNKKNANQLQLTRNIHRMSQLQNEINQILLDIWKKKQKNLLSLRIIHDKTAQIECLNPEIVYEDIKEANKNIKKLESQKQYLLEAYHTIRNKHAFMLEKSQEFRQTTSQSQLDYRSKIYKINKMKETHEYINKQLAEKKCQKLKNKDQLQKKQYKANKLRTLIGNIDLKRKKRMEKFEEQKQKISLKYDPKVQQAKQKVTSLITDQLSKISHEMRILDQQAEQLFREDQELKFQIKSYNDSIAKQPNPIGQILAFQHSLFRKNIRN